MTKAKNRKGRHATRAVDDPANRLPSGRFLPGHKHPGPGRPPAIDFRGLIQERAKDGVLSIPEAVWSVYKSLLKNALEGDVQSSRLLLERLCEPAALPAAPVAPVDVSVVVQPGQVGPPVPSSQRMADYIDHFARVALRLRQAPPQLLSEQPLDEPANGNGSGNGHG